MVDTKGAVQASASIDSMSFEDALTELESIVRDLESGRGKLEEAVSAYERGAALRRHCEAKLAEAEAKLQAVVETPGGLTLRDAG